MGNWEWGSRTALPARLCDVVPFIFRSLLSVLCSPVLGDPWSRGPESAIMEIMSESQFEALEGALKSDGARAAFDKLEEVLLTAKKYPQLFEALLMRKRHALG